MNHQSRTKLPNIELKSISIAILSLTISVLFWNNVNLCFTWNWQLFANLFCILLTNSMLVSNLANVQPTIQVDLKCNYLFQVHTTIRIFYNHLEIWIHRLFMIHFNRFILFWWIGYNDKKSIKQHYWAYFLFVKY